MNYCIYIRKRKGKPFCKYFNKETTWEDCKECKEKIYKTKKRNNSVYKKNAQYFKNTVQSKVQQYSKIQNNVQKRKKMSLKSKKQVKKEKERYSVFTANDYCMVCKSTYLLTWNEIFRGRNRSNSMKYGFCLRMCLKCHQQYQEDITFNNHWHKKAQQYFEEHYGNREDFINIFKRNYL